MRHLLSLIAGLVIAPLAWALLGMGQAGTATITAAWQTANAFDTADLIKPGAYLAAAGILLGVIATLRISPLGPLTAALVYLGLSVGLFVDPFALGDAVPGKWSIAGEAIELRAPLFNGTLLAVGVLLLVSVVSVKRWRSWPAQATAAGTAEADTDPTADAVPQPGTDLNPEPKPRPDSTTVGTGASLATSSATATFGSTVESPNSSVRTPTAIPPRPRPGSRSPRGKEPEPSAGTADADTSEESTSSPWSAPPRPPERTP